MPHSPNYRNAFFLAPIGATGITGGYVSVTFTKAWAGTRVRCPCSNACASTKQFTMPRRDGRTLLGLRVDSESGPNRKWGCRGPLSRLPPISTEPIWPLRNAYNGLRRRSPWGPCIVAFRAERAVAPWPALSEFSKRGSPLRRPACQRIIGLMLLEVKTCESAIERAITGIRRAHPRSREGIRAGGLAYKMRRKTALPRRGIESSAHTQSLGPYKLSQGILPQCESHSQQRL